MRAFQLLDPFRERGRGVGRFRNRFRSRRGFGGPVRHLRKGRAFAPKRFHILQLLLPLAVFARHPVVALPEFGQSVEQRTPFVAGVRETGCQGSGFCFKSRDDGRERFSGLSAARTTTVSERCERRILRFKVSLQDLPRFRVLVVLVFDAGELLHHRFGQFVRFRRCRFRHSGVEFRNPAKPALVEFRNLLSRLRSAGVFVHPNVCRRQFATRFRKFLALVDRQRAGPKRGRCFRFQPLRLRPFLLGDLPGIRHPQRGCGRNIRVRLRPVD